MQGDFSAAGTEQASDAEETYGERFMRSLEIRYDGMSVDEGIHSKEVIEAVEELVTDASFELFISREDVFKHANEKLKPLKLHYFTKGLIIRILQDVCDHCEGVKMPVWDPAHRDLV